jgi:hypothetical protein
MFVSKSINSCNVRALIAKLFSRFQLGSYQRLPGAFPAFGRQGWAASNGQNEPPCAHLHRRKTPAKEPEAFRVIQTELYRDYKIEVLVDDGKLLLLIEGEPFECSEIDLDRAIDCAKIDIDEGLAW